MQKSVFLIMSLLKKKSEDKSDSKNKTNKQNWKKNLTQGIKKNLHNENFQRLEKFVGTGRWKDLLCSWTDTLYSVQINLQDSNVISIRIPIIFLKS